MTVNVSIFYQNTGFTSSKSDNSNTRHHFRMNSALPPLRAKLHLRKKSKYTVSKFKFNPVKSLLQ